MGRIIRVEIWQVDLTPRTQLAEAARGPVGHDTPMVRIVTDDGANGTGWAHVASGGGAPVAALLRSQLAPRLIGRNELHVEAIWKELWLHTRSCGSDALVSPALAALDIALWDLKCKRAKQPLHLVAGGAQQRVRVHSPECGELRLDTAALVDRVLDAKAAGFRGAKIRVGHAHVAEDVARLRSVRERVGDAFELIVDAGQAFTLPEAIRRARQYEPFNLAWIEQPLPVADIEGHTRLAQSTVLPIALGDTLGHLAAFREHLQRGACTILQPDVMQLGGITPWLKVAHLAEAFNVPVCTRSSLELHASLCAAVPNAIWVEHAPRLDDVTASRLRIESGHAYPPCKPGAGIEWDEGQLARRRAGAAATVV